jgi:hypothetical protein
MAISVHHNVMTIFQGIWLGVFLILNRRTKKTIWCIYVLFLSIIFIIQWLSVFDVKPFAFRKIENYFHLLIEIFELFVEFPLTNITINNWSNFSKLKYFLFLHDQINTTTDLHHG